MIIIDFKNRKVKLCNEILETMKKYIQRSDFDMEAGGIILGRENLGNNNLIFEYVTKPMKNDVRTKTRFIRKDLGHLDYYRELYVQHNGVYAYIGEWHSHPEDTPHYSIIDLANWKRISKDDPKKFQYHIIIGRKSIRIWKMKKGCLRPKLIYEGKWNEIIF